MSVAAIYMQEPHELHWKKAKRILHYVQGTIDYGIHYVAGAQLDLTKFTDSDWAGDENDRKPVDCMGRPGFTIINQQHP